MQSTTIELKVADQVWIAVALLHRERPAVVDFSPNEIIARLEIEHLSDRLPAGVRPHISRHTVANLAPETGRYRMLFATTGARRRLFRPGDVAHPKRDGKVTPRAADLPPKYVPLLEWYATVWSRGAASDPLEGVAATYADLWRDARGDRYVTQLREGWE